MLQPRFSLDRRYTVFGRVVSGMQYVDAIHKGEPPAVMSRMVQVSVAADNKPIPPASMLTETVPAPAVVPTVSVDELNAPIGPSSQGGARTVMRVDAFDFDLPC